MPSRFDRVYRMLKGTILGPDYFNPIWQDLDDRLAPLEDKRTDEEAVYRSIEDRVLARSEAVIQDLRARLVQITSLEWLVALSGTPATLAEGAAVSLSIVPDDRALFAPGPFAIVSRTSTPDDYAVVRTLGYDRTLGQYDFTVVTAAVAPGPHADWIIAAVAGSTLAQMQLLAQGKTLRDVVVAAKDTVVPLASQVAADRAAVTPLAAQVATDRTQTGLDRVQTGLDRAAVATGLAAIAGGPVASINGKTGIVFLDPVDAAPLPPSLDLSLTTPDSIDPAWFSRLSTASRIRASGLLETVSAGVLCIAHDPLTGSNLGTMFREQRTNLLLNTVAPWTGSALAAGWAHVGLAFANDGTMGPDGVTPALKLTTNNATGDTILYQGTAKATGGTYVYAARIKQGTSPIAQIELFFYGGTSKAVAANLTWSTLGITTIGTDIVGYGIEPDANGCWLFWIAATDTGGNTGVRSDFRVAQSTTGQSIYFSGSQLELGTRPTSYIPTLGETAARAADILAIPGDPAWLNTVEGTGFVEFWNFGRFDGTQYSRLLALSDGSSANAMSVAIYPGYPGLAVGLSCFRGGSYLTDVIGPSGAPKVPALGRNRFAWTYKANRLAISLNGQAIGESTGFGAVPAISQMSVGSLGGGAFANTAISRATYLPRAVSDTALQRMSAL